MVPPLSSVDLNLILEDTSQVWEEMRGQRIFITGGTGFFGCWLVESFLFINEIKKLGASATVLTRDPGAFARKCPHIADRQAISLHRGDVRDFVYPRGEFGFVIHAATDTTRQLASYSPAQLLDTILRGTERVLDFARAARTNKFLFTSSGAVYGKQPVSITHLDEEYLGAPDQLSEESAYGQGKRAAELMCRKYGDSFGIECKIARCFAFVGPHLPLSAHFAIGNFILDALQGDVIQVRGDGSPIRSYMYSAELTIWLWWILFRGPAFEAFNVGSEHAVSILQLAFAVKAALRPEAAIKVVGQVSPHASLLQYVPSTEKARRVLDLKCDISLEESIRRTASWHRELLGM